MLQPTRTKYRKAHKGRIHGYSSRGVLLNYGSYGLKAIEPESVMLPNTQLYVGRG